MPDEVEPDGLDEWLDVPLPRPSNIIGALQYAFAKELQYLDGVPCTVCRENCEPADSVIKVISTFGAPAKGAYNFDGINVTYGERNTANLSVLSSTYPQVMRPQTIPRGAVGRLVTRDILPTRYYKDPNAAENGGSGEEEEG